MTITPPSPPPTVQGLKKDETLDMTHDSDEWKLTPLGHWNWKWNQARGNYSTYEQEVLSGILTIAANMRIVGHLPIVWLCDQRSTMQSSDQRPPIETKVTQMVGLSDTTPTENPSHSRQPKRTVRLHVTEHLQRKIAT